MFLDIMMHLEKTVQVHFLKMIGLDGKSLMGNWYRMKKATQLRSLFSIIFIQIVV